MGCSILWLLHLASVFLLIAATCALAAWCRKPIWRRFWPILIAILALLPTASYGVFGAYLIKQNVQPKWLFWYGLSLTIVYIGGSVLILRYGLKGATSEKPVGRSWHRLPLIVATVLFLLIYCIVISAIDTRMLIHLTNIRVEATSDLMNLLPAKLPDTLNAGTLYEQAAQSLGTKLKDTRWLSDSDKPDFDVTSNKVTEILDDSQSTLQLVREAAALTEYSLNPGMSNFYLWPIPNYLNYRNFGRLLTLSARRKALNSDLNGALKELGTMKKMVTHFLQYPVLISFMIGGAVDKERIAGLEYVLTHMDKLSGDSILFPLRVPSSALPEFRQSIQVEAKGQLQGFASIASSGNPLSGGGEPQSTSSLDAVITPLWRIFMLPSDLKSARQIAKLMSQEAVSYREIKSIFNEINENAEAGEFGMFTAIATPAYSNYILRAKQFDTQRNLETLALAVTAYRYNTGKDPVKIDDLVPDYLDRVPPDPFDAEQPLQMKPIKGGLDLFSKGPDSTVKSHDRGPIHFYIGSKAYGEFRIKPAAEESRKRKEKRKKRKK
jgi:hypothetical protein